MVEYEGRTFSEMTPITQITQHRMPLVSKYSLYNNRLADTAQEGVEVGGDDVSVLQVTGEDITVCYPHL